MKAGHEHRIPLTKRAVQLLKSLPRLPHNDHVFPGHGKGKPLSGMAMTMQLRRMNRGDITVHGFRPPSGTGPRSRRHSRMRPASMPWPTDQRQGEAAYRRGDQFEKRRKLMEAATF